MADEPKDEPSDAREDSVDFVGGEPSEGEDNLRDLSEVLPGTGDQRTREELQGHWYDGIFGFVRRHSKKGIIGLAAVSLLWVGNCARHSLTDGNVLYDRTIILNQDEKNPRIKDTRHVKYTEGVGFSNSNVLELGVPGGNRYEFVDNDGATRIVASALSPPAFESDRLERIVVYSPSGKRIREMNLRETEGDSVDAQFAREVFESADGFYNNVRGLIRGELGAKIENSQQRDKRVYDRDWTVNPYVKLPTERPTSAPTEKPE